ncbi:MAG: 23S rRNA (uracil(1939)-C(5))-methyltransferase RlmD [Christensenellaceae bacterium]|jgi:23S rRNA (uracil1939-C5)-methyltransferase|nr:23S rRNA (uracil(1939)-C(5))-methyltransferase RlmD [Christensenellaceae bacterium]
MRAGQLFTATIERAADFGRGVAHADGQTVFVAGALPGEELRCAFERAKGKVAFARAVEPLSPSPLREKPPCPLFLRCGGCDMQHMGYETELAQKQQVVSDALTRIGGFAAGEFELLPILGAKQPLHYRNKAVFPVGGRSGRAEIGFFQRQSHDIVPAEGCLLLPESMGAAAKAFLAWMNEFAIPPADASGGEGLVRHLMLRQNRAGRTLAVPVLLRGELPRARELSAALQSALGERFAGLCVNINPGPEGEILGERCETLFGEAALQEELLGLRFEISPLSFFQVNPAQAELLYGKALEFAGLRGGETAVDAYCGAGGIALLMARRAKEVLGIESLGAAVRNAAENARRNGIQNARFLQGRCEVLLPKLFREGAPDLLTLDPPRKGCDPELLSAILAAAPRRIVYVSCNPATLARDLKTLCAAGRYALLRAQAIDMFPRTGHVECVALLERRYAASHGGLRPPYGTPL